jgi:lipoprotein-releasing system ATP-binding protein
MLANHKSQVPGPKLQLSASGGIRREESEKSLQSADLGSGAGNLGLKITDLRKAFESPTGERIGVLRGASLSATGGEIVAIMGASGAGKSTLLHLIGGLEAADHGSILLGQFPIDRAKPAALARLRNAQVGFIFQFHHLLTDLSAAENVALPLMIARTGQREAMRRSIQALADLGLGGRVAYPVGHLSGGEQQRVAVCRALIAAPSLVLADEPTGNLDNSTGEEIGKFLVSYARDHHAIVILATHNERLAHLCHRVLRLRDGKVYQS